MRGRLQRAALLAAGFSQLAVAASLDWEKLPPLPDREGVAGAYAGVSDGTLLVAGGANFPGRMPWDGGRKVWHDTVFALERPEGPWAVAGRLPRPLAYGVSASSKLGVVCVGGSDADRHYADAFVLTLTNGACAVRPLPGLPMGLANAAGALVGETLYVCGGCEQPGERAALNRLFALDLAAGAPGWRELDPLPGRPRLLPAAAVIGEAFYVIGGAALEPGEGGVRRVWLREVWRYQASQGWQRRADLPEPRVAAPSPTPVRGTRCFVVGGDDGAAAAAGSPATHPGFPGVAFAYDASADVWGVAGPVPAPRATVPAIWWRGRHVLPSGEVRPGVRSPEVWTLRLER